MFYCFPPVFQRAAEKIHPFSLHGNNTWCSVALYTHRPSPEILGRFPKLVGVSYPESVLQFNPLTEIGPNGLIVYDVVVVLLVLLVDVLFLLFCEFLPPHKNVFAGDASFRTPLLLRCKTLHFARLNYELN